MINLNFTKIVFKLVLLFIFTENVFSQIYTPEGQGVTTSSPSRNFKEASWWFDNIIDYYSLNATIVDESDGSYNCHGYAWVLTEGGDKVVLKDDQEFKYFGDSSYSNDGDPSYLEITDSSIATHACYEPAKDHSIRVIQDDYPISDSSTQIHVSKWGDGPLVRHGLREDWYAFDYAASHNDSLVPIKYYILKKTHSGTLSNYPKTWIGAGGQTHTISSTVTVPSSCTLTIKKGATVNFQNGAQLKVYGTLLVEGTDSDKVTFNFGSPNSSTYNGIKFYYGSNGSIENAVIKNAFYGVYVMNAAPTIENCEIFDCTYGIQSYYNSPTIETNEIYDITNYGIYTYSGSPEITDNYIHDTDDYGITVNSSTNTYIRDNTIEDCKGGVYAYGSQTIKLYDDGLNKISGYTSSGHAVLVTGGTAHLGEYHDQGKNSLIRNSSNEVVYNSSTNEVLAEKNYWGASPDSTWFYGDVSYDFPLSSAPTGVGSSLGKTIESDLSEDRVLFAEAMESLDSDNVEEGCTKLKYLIQNYPDSRYAGIAVSWVVSSEKSRKDYGLIKDFLEPLENHSNQKVKDNYLLWLAKIESDAGNKIAVENLVKNTSIDDNLGLELRLNWANDLINVHDDMKSAEKVFDEIIDSDASHSTLMTIESMKNHAINHSEVEGLNKEYDESYSFKPKTDQSVVLSNAFPNPFNPTTNITYQLPNDAHVKLIVYNSLGQIVNTLVDQNKSAGRYSVTFNAKNLPSGVYFYRIQAGDYVSTKKMLLMK